MFYAYVLAARLKSEGFDCFISTPTSALSIVPVDIDIMVDLDHLDQAREILLFDSVEAIFTDNSPEKRRPRYFAKKWWLNRRMNKK